MKVAVAYESCKPLIVEDLPLPEVGRRDVVVRIAASGMCHTDLTVIQGDSALQLPIVPGHEACGTVEEVGSDVHRVKSGDRVLASVSPACGSCWWCLNGMSNHCVYGPIVRVASRFNLPNGQTARAICGCGAFAEAMVVDEASVVAVDTFLPDEELALLGCGVTTGVGAALNTAGVIPGSSVVVLGCGGVGQSVIQGARIAGASTIIAVDPELSRRTLSAELGATDALDPSDADPVLAVMELTGGRGADYAFEAVGHPRLMAQAFDMTRAEGTVTLVGMAKANDMLSLSATSAVFSGKTIKGSTMGGAQILRDFPRIIKLVETKQLNLGSMVSQTIGLAEVNDGLEAMKQAQGIRTIIVPT